ncbi:MAG: glycosyltransferase family 2 protein [Candidatus Dormiibacterota bacterium]
MFQKLEGRSAGDQLVDALTRHLNIVLGGRGRALRADRQTGEPGDDVSIVVAADGAGEGYPVSDFQPAFTGVATPISGNSSVDRQGAVPVSILDRWGTGVAETVPDGFTVLAVVTAYNESDIIVGTIRRLLDQGVRVHLVDNWSKDGSLDLVEQSFGSDEVAIERFPAGGPSAHFELRSLLARVDEIAAGASTSWVIHHDADEIRESPWLGQNLRAGLYKVDRAGFTCVDHTVLDFRPVGDEITGADPVEALRSFEWGQRPGHFVQVKARQRQPRGVDLARAGGHDVTFPGRRVFPYKFLLRHYPIRSQEHGERKVFADRQPRWSPAERASGWHVQYDRYRPGSSFLWDRSTLLDWDAEDFHRRWLVQRVSGVGIPREADRTAPSTRARPWWRRWR